MSENPQTSNGFLPIANELAEALARTYLSSYESQFLWCLFRKTYGWGKKDDWISLSQIAEMTGISMPNVSRTKRKLLGRNIVVQTDNKISFNKYYSQWRRLSEQTSKGKTSFVVQTDNYPPSIQTISPPSKQRDTIDTITKDTLQKTGQEKNDRDELGRRFLSAVVQQGWCDDHYANKTLDQALKLSQPHRDEFFRKVKVMLASARGEKTRGLARKIYHEAAGFVNDKQMNDYYTTEEKARRELWLEETGQREEA